MSKECCNAGDNCTEQAPLVTFYQTIDASVAARLKNIRLVVFDVDGTLTEGGIFLDRGENELKCFNCQDGMGIALLNKAGIEVAIITGRNSPLTERRARELRIAHIIQGSHDKATALAQIWEKTGFSSLQTAVMGDDINDIPLFDNAAISASPSDGYHYMLCKADIRLTRRGGKGAARELCDLILMAQGHVGTDGRPDLLLGKTGDDNPTAQ